MKNSIRLVFVALLFFFMMEGFKSFALEQKSAGPLDHTINGYVYSQRVPVDYVYRTGRVYETRGAGTGGANSVSKLGEKGGKINTAQVAGNNLSTTTLRHENEIDLRAAVKDMVGRLLGSGGDEDLRDYVVAVSTFVNLNNLYKTSSLGRYLTEQMIGELQLAGVQVIDIRKTPGFLISRGYGEYSLSRDMDELSYVQQADAVVVGTYTFIEKRIYINARLLKKDDGLVLASAGFESPMGETITRLLADEGMPVSPAPPIKVRALP